MKKFIATIFLITGLTLQARVVARPVSVRPVSRPMVHRATPVRVSTPKPVSVRPTPTIKTHVSTPAKTITPVKTMSSTPNTRVYTTPTSNFSSSPSPTITTTGSSNFLQNWLLYRAVSNNHGSDKNELNQAIIEVEQEIKKLSVDPIKNKDEIAFLNEVLKRLKRKKGL